MSSSAIRVLAYDAHNLFYADEQRQLVSIAFDTSTGTVSGSPAVVANVVGFQPSTYWTAFTVAQNGTLIYNTGVGAAQSVLTWMDRSGKELGRIGDPAIMANPTLSPDGSRVAVDISDQKANNVDVWIESTTGTGNSRFTFDPLEEVVGVWSRDGSTLAYRNADGDGPTLYLKPATGLEREKKRFTLPSTTMDDLVPNSWSLDDQQILFTHQVTSGEYLELLPVAGGEPTRFLTSKGSETNGQISPDGKWVAYASDESGDWEIYVTSFPGAAGKWQVSRGGGTEPRWRGDGKEIFYHRTQRHVDGSAGQRRKHLRDRHTRASVPDSWARPDFLDRRFYLRRGQGWQALPGESLREARTRATADDPAEYRGGRVVITWKPPAGTPAHGFRLNKTAAHCSRNVYGLNRHHALQ